MNWVKLSVVFLWLLAFNAGLADVPWASGESKAEDLRIKLVTFGRGDDIPAWWGHVAIIVEDITNQRARIYNFGLFSFDDGMLFNFAMGRLIFQVGDFNVPGYLNWYRAQNRDVRILSLNIQPQKRLEFAKKLAVNVLPQNRDYLYHHYDDNCATRLRDLFDDAVDGQLFNNTNVLGRMTLRDHTKRYVAHNPVMEMLLMFLMNDSIDKPITQWQEMFLPDELERRIAEIVYKNERLVTDSLVYFKAEREPLPADVPLHWPGAMLAGIIIAMIAVGLSMWSANTSNQWAVTFFSSWNVLTGILIGVPGLALAFMAGFTDHTVTYYNENLLLANPLTFLIVPLGFALAMGKKRALNWLKLIWYLHVLCALLAIGLKILPGFDQDNWLVIAFLLPVYLGFAYSFYFFDKKS